MALKRKLNKSGWEALKAELKAEYKEVDGEYVLDTEGDEDVSGLKSALGKEREARQLSDKKYKALFDKWEGLDPEEVRSLLEKMDTDEDAKLLKAGKMDELVNRKAEKAISEANKKMTAAQKQTEAVIEENKMLRQGVVDNAIREAASKAGIHAHAVDDALFRGRAIFAYDGGNVIQLEDGKPKLGKDGKTNYGPSEWLEGMKETAPHWFPVGNGGGGSLGDRGGGGGSGKRVVKRAAYDAMSPMERDKVAKDPNVTFAD